MLWLITLSVVLLSDLLWCSFGIWKWFISLASCLFLHTIWLNKHVWAKYRPRKKNHGCFHLFSLCGIWKPVQNISNRGLFKKFTWCFFPKLRLLPSFFCLTEGDKWHVTGLNNLGELNSFHWCACVCVSAKGPWRGYWDGRLHPTRDSTSGLQFQELLYWDGV